MRSERGQATVEWVGLVLLVALVLGFIVTRARDTASPEDRHGLGDLVAQRIASAGGAPLQGGAPLPGSGEPSGGSGGRRAPALPDGRAPPGRREAGVVAPGRSEAGVVPPLVPLPGRELLRAGTRKVVAVNGLVCYLRKSTAGEDTNRVGDDIGDAVNCLNPVSGWTGELGGTDDR